MAARWLAHLGLALSAAASLTLLLIGCTPQGGAAAAACEGGEEGSCPNKAAGDAGAVLVSPSHKYPEELQVEIHFQNQAKEAMEIWWSNVDLNTGALDPPVKIVDVPPGGATFVQSQAGHVQHWVRPSGGAEQGAIVKVVHAFHGMPPSIYTGGDFDFAQEFNAAGAPKALWPTAKRSRNCDNAPEHDSGVCANIAKGTQRCADNPGWMSVNCPKACGWCHLKKSKVRCTRRNLNMSVVPALNPGDLDAKFRTLRERVATRHPNVNITTLSDSPHVLLLENFVSDEEADQLIEAAGGQGFKISTEQGVRDENGVMTRTMNAKQRSSENAWCRGRCVQDRHVKRITARIEEFVGVPRGNFEYYQVVRYEPGQFYGEHHDSTTLEEPAGPRIFTFFLYLSDVEEGGETAFKSLPGGRQLAVKPKKGTALLWPGVLNDDPSRTGIDPRTRHEAKPVITGTKYAANAWIRLYDYRIPNHWACTGAID